VTLYQIFRDAYERSKSPTATTDSCERAGVNAVMRQMVHTCADLIEGARKKVKSEANGKEIAVELGSGSECAAFLRSITEK
jgi:hypothetical protein